MTTGRCDRRLQLSDGRVRGKVSQKPNPDTLVEFITDAGEESLHYGQ